MTVTILKIIHFSFRLMVTELCLNIEFLDTSRIFTSSFQPEGLFLKDQLQVWGKNNPCCGSTNTRWSWSDCDILPSTTFPPSILTCNAGLLTLHCTWWRQACNHSPKPLREEATGDRLHGWWEPASDASKVSISPYLCTPRLNELLTLACGRVSFSSAGPEPSAWVGFVTILQFNINSRQKQLGGVTSQGVHH